MKKIIFLSLFLFSLNGYCQWTFNNRFDDGTNIYIDYSTRKIDGNLVRIWMMGDRIKPETFQGMTYLSSSLHYEFDCKNDQFRILTSYYYPQNMGSGSILGQWGPSQWFSIPPGSHVMNDLKKVCRR
jgi:hypothetical protein